MNIMNKWKRLAEYLFGLFDPSDLPVEEEISTRGPTDFEEILILIRQIGNSVPKTSRSLNTFRHNARSDFCFHIHFLLSCSPLRFSLCYANHCQIILQYGWLSFELLICYDLGVFMYKTMNGLSPAISSFQNVKDIHQYQTRSATNGNLYISNVNTLASQRAIPVAVAKLWNEIPTEIRNAETLDTFSSKLKTFYLSQQEDMIQHTRFLFFILFPYN